MKLAEALILRADCQKRIEQIKQRLLRNAKVQEGDAPGENPTELITELEGLTSQLQQLIQQINRTNSTIQLEGIGTLSDGLAVRDILTMRFNIYRDLAQAATIVQERHTHSEVKFQSTINVAELQRQADDLAKERRELDTKVQQANWNVDLIES